MDNRESNRIFDILLIVTAMCVLFGLGMAIFIMPDNEFSEQENRYLQQMPSISIENGLPANLLDGSFTRDIAEYYADQFPLRNSFTGLKAAAEIGMLRRENNGVILAKDDFLVTKDSPPDYDNLGQNIEYVEMFAETMGAIDVPVALAVAPRTLDCLTAAGGYLPSTYDARYSDDLWKFYGQKAGALDNAQSIDLLDRLKNELSSGRDDAAGSLYYRTDHHWTTAGAYAAYYEIARSFGIEEQDMVVPDYIEIASEDFFGTTWSKAGMKWVRPDRLEYYRYDGDEGFVTSIIDTGASLNGFYDRAYLDTNDKYGSFISGINARVDVTRLDEQGTGEAESPAPRPKLLLIKDSFAHALVPFLAYHYDMVILDLRGFSAAQSVAEIVLTENIEQVLFLYGIEGFMETRDLGKLLGGLDVSGG